ncbi:hypothetical protein B0H63DRAFT_305544 [Podospora didyma]|uniref:Uncharacterized protein n=1 Tax=Podospora didyma TaxID=330526 RepID=A0AAE0K4N4_9PEZI|nr:hypothetical protein B0H63DRAFT_305544 [Podospora didyma]
MTLSSTGRSDVAASPLRRGVPQLLSSSTAATIALAAAFLPMASGHEHGEDNIPGGEAVSKDPIDAILWAHIFVQMLAFGIMFPLGMVLGIVKSRWHVPLQIVATLIALLGYALGHLHKGRQFISSNIHAKFGNTVFFLMVAQIAFGIYLKLHLEKGIHGRIRRVVRILHSVNGKVFPIVSWAQMLFGGITALGFCQDDHLGQCLAHFIMGSAFIAYGILLTILLLVGQVWLRRTGRSQEFFDSVVIAAWGCVNTFTEHRWGTAWVRNDWQHTAMGIIWWSAGLAGIWLSKGRDGLPKRNFIPGFVIIITGWAMSAHPQTMPISAMAHKVFGYTLMTFGVVRIIEISFVLQDKPGVSEDGTESSSFQFIPCFLLIASGFLFMGATEEQMSLVAASGLDHVAYILILFSLAFVLFLFVNMLIHVYDSSTRSAPIAKTTANGRVRPNSRTDEEGQLHNAGEFELEGLMSDDEDEEQAARRKLIRDDRADEGIASPSTLGQNGNRVA